MPLDDEGPDGSDHRWRQAPSWCPEPANLHPLGNVGLKHTQPTLDDGFELRGSGKVVKRNSRFKLPMSNAPCHHLLPEDSHRTTHPLKASSLQECTFTVKPCSQQLL